MISDLDFDLPAGPELPPPPRVPPEIIFRWVAERMADYYRSEHYDRWRERTLAEMRGAEPFEM